MERRMCVSCRFYQTTSSVSLGRCGHPERQLHGVTPLVRAGELGCRRGFEIDDWVPAIITAGPYADDILISERPAPFNPAWNEMPMPGPDVASPEPAHN